MLEEKTVLKDFSKFIDKKLEFDKIIGGFGGKIAESIDGVLFKLAIEAGFEKLPNDYKEEALSVMDGIVKGDPDMIAEGVIQSLVENIKTPLGDEKEQIILGGLWDIVGKLIAVK